MQTAWIVAVGWIAKVAPAHSPQIFPLLYFAAIAGSGVGVYGFFRGFGLLRRKRIIVDTPTSTIRAAPLGHIEVSGKAVGPYTLLSPLAQQECYYYRAVAWTRDRQKESWKKATEEILRAPLFLDDGTGRLLVDPTGAELDLRPAFQETYNNNPFSDAVPDSVQNFLSRRGRSMGSHWKLEEFCILPGEQLFMQGVLRENTAEEQQGDGQLLGREAAAVQRQVELERMFLPGERMVEREPDANTSDEFAGDLRVVLARGDGQWPFFISEHSQQQLLQTLTWKSSLYLWGGPALTLTCLWYLLSR